MLRTKGLTDKLLLLGIDGMDPRFSKKMVDEGKMPNLKKLIDSGAARDDLMLLGAMPTITPPMWATLATGCYPMTHGITDYHLQVPGELDIILPFTSAGGTGYHLGSVLLQIFARRTAVGCYRSRWQKDTGLALAWRCLAANQL